MGLSLGAGAAGMSAPGGCGGSDPSAAGAVRGPVLSSCAHATSWDCGATGPEGASAGAEPGAREEAIEAAAGGKPRRQVIARRAIRLITCGK